MNSKTLSNQALKAIDSYRHFRIANAVTDVPYFNNKTIRARFSERTRVGKGNAADILEELKIILVKNHVNADVLADESLKKLLVENNLGIDCSALAYYVLDAENEARGHGRLNRNMTFIKGGNPIAKMLSYLRPVQNCDVKTFASDINSRVVTLKKARPGDFITILGGSDGDDRNHILVIHEIDYENDSPKTIHYSHAIAYPEDGRYGSGIKQGKIEIAFADEPLTKQVWTEEGSPEKARSIFERALASTTELRRLKWLA